MFVHILCTKCDIDRMTTDEKEALCRFGQFDLKACAIRARAARDFAKITQAELGEKIQKGKAAISNVEKGRSFPSRDLMMYFFREHRIDFNFMISGHYSQLPSDVQDRIFASLAVANNELDQESSSR